MRNGNVWRVRFTGVRATLAISHLDNCPRVNGEAIVRCGGAGAVWLVQRKERPDGDTLILTLEPFDGHHVNPLAMVPELPMPEDVV